MPKEERRVWMLDVWANIDWSSNAPSFICYFLSRNAARGAFKRTVERNHFKKNEVWESYDTDRMAAEYVRSIGAVYGRDESLQILLHSEPVTTKENFRLDEWCFFEEESK